MKRTFLLSVLGLCLLAASSVYAAMRVDIYGPGQNSVNLALAAPLTGPEKEAGNMGAELQKLINENLSFLPFMRLTDPKAVLGGTVLQGYEPPNLDFKRFQLAGSDIVVTTYWPNGDRGTSSVQIRAFETNTGGRLFGKEYPRVSSKELPEVADRFCADLLEVLTGSGAFFRST
ncbi:MAG: translocation protein TolB, partial [Desulfovibrio sp.]|nr:translocation protein TolB [Desulfovibrio sp.]